MRNGGHSLPESALSSRCERCLPAYLVRRSKRWQREDAALVLARTCERHVYRRSVRGGSDTVKLALSNGLLLTVTRLIATTLPSCRMRTIVLLPRLAT